MTDKLHAAVCQAVALLNMAPELARSPDGREAHTILRQALVDYADESKSSADVVPGVMHCARCKFRLNRVNLNVNVGTVSAGDNHTEPCPNGCGPLWPVTWEQEAREGYKVVEDMFGRAERFKSALRELVALKDIKDECLRRRQRRPCSVTRVFPQDLLDAEADYNERKPKAWAAAREALLK